MCVSEKSAVFVSIYNQHSKMAAVLANYVFEWIAVYLLIYLLLNFCGNNSRRKEVIFLVGNPVGINAGKSSA